LIRDVNKTQYLHPRKNLIQFDIRPRGSEITYECSKNPNKQLQ
jgi:hypothetical protein